MITDISDSKRLLVSLDETWNELTKLVSSIDNTTINVVPFKDSWTVAQLASHITRSNNAIVQALKMEGKSTARKQDERAVELREMFLDFSIKFKSPGFITPKENYFQKEILIENLKKSISQLIEMRDLINFSQVIILPPFGEITKFELLHFVLYHTQRHIYQLKKIIKVL